MCTDIREYSCLLCLGNFNLLIHCHLEDTDIRAFKKLVIKIFSEGRTLGTCQSWWWGRKGDVVRLLLLLSCGWKSPCSFLCVTNVDFNVDPACERNYLWNISTLRTPCQDLVLASPMWKRKYYSFISPFVSFTLLGALPEPGLDCQPRRCTSHSERCHS